MPVKPMTVPTVILMVLVVVVNIINRRHMQIIFQTLSFIVAIWATIILIGKILQFIMFCIKNRDAHLQNKLYLVVALWWGVFFYLMMLK